jgi:excisionase family DNA binding protein
MVGSVMFMTKSVHVSSATEAEELSHDARVLRSVLGRMRSAEGRGLVEELIAGLLADGVVLARVNDVVTPREAGELLGVSRQFIDKLIADGRLAAQFKPGSRHRVVRVADVLELEASRRVAADRIGATIDVLVDGGAEY